jgi:protein transport protein SEC13
VVPAAHLKSGQPTNKVTLPLLASLQKTLICNNLNFFHLLMMATSMAPVAFDTQHEDLIHDAQMDYYGKRLATGSSDRTVRIFQVEPNQPEKLVCSLTGHEGPVWQVAWAHPKFGSLLASCSYDGKVIIWKESQGAWIKVKEYKGHESSVNSVAWAPHDYGLLLVKEWNAHQIGANSVAWCPSSRPESLLSAMPSGVADEVPIFSEMRLATGGCDNLVKIWKFKGNEWAVEHELARHTDWVRDVAWAPNIGVPCHTVVSCSQDRTVLVWKSTDGTSWSSKQLGEQFPDTLWRVNFSPAGNLLAVAGGDNHITMWREKLDGEWECVTNVDQASLAQKQ